MKDMKQDTGTGGRVPNKTGNNHLTSSCKSGSWKRNTSKLNLKVRLARDFQIVIFHPGLQCRSLTCLIVSKKQKKG